MRIRTTIPVLLLAVILVAGCGEQKFDQGQNQSKPTGVTGILLNVKMPDSADTNAVAASTTKSWKVVDPTGTVIFSSSDAGQSSLYEFRRAEALSRKYQLGQNPKEFGITSFKVEEGEGDTRTMTFTVSDFVASEMRGLPNLMELLRGSHLVILCGKTGQ